MSPEMTAVRSPKTWYEARPEESKPENLRMCSVTVAPVFSPVTRAGFDSRSSTRYGRPGAFASAQAPPPQSLRGETARQLLLTSAALAATVPNEIQARPFPSAAAISGARQPASSVPSSRLIDASASSVVTSRPGRALAALLLGAASSTVPTRSAVATGFIANAPRGAVEL